MTRNPLIPLSWVQRPLVSKPFNSTIHIDTSFWKLGHTKGGNVFSLLRPKFLSVCQINAPALAMICFPGMESRTHLRFLSQYYVRSPYSFSYGLFFAQFATGKIGNKMGSVYTVRHASCQMMAKGHPVWQNQLTEERWQEISICFTARGWGSRIYAQTSPVSQLQFAWGTRVPDSKIATSNLNSMLWDSPGLVVLRVCLNSWLHHRYAYKLRRILYSKMWPTLCWIPETNWSIHRATTHSSRLLGNAPIQSLSEIYFNAPPHYKQQQPNTLFIEKRGAFLLSCQLSTGQKVLPRGRALKHRSPAGILKRCVPKLCCTTCFPECATQAFRHVLKLNTWSTQNLEDSFSAPPSSFSLKNKWKVRLLLM